MKKISLVLAILSVTSLFADNSAFAENRIFIKEYTYLASDMDSKVSSRAIALEQVKRALLEQLGTYLISETEVKNFQLTRDQISTLTAGIVSAEVMDEKWDGRSYSLKAKIAADPDQVAKSVDALRADVQKTKELEDLRKKAEAAMREIDRLKQELQSAKADPKKQGEYAKAVKDLGAADWFAKGYAYYESKDFVNAVDAYTKALELSPKEANIYNNRGNTYGKLGNYQQAVSDYGKALALEPKHAAAYYNRGIAYRRLGNFQQAIADYDKAIELYPGYAEAYNGRGIVYGRLGNYKQAIVDYTKALELNPNLAQTYYNLGVAFLATGQDDKANRSFKVGAQLGNKEAQDYLTANGITW